jgi:outer membrane protein OmpA-like peptidoglycan-associated protein/curli biogenesis system outer membrane secretion channel CsgG
MLGSQIGAVPKICILQQGRMMMKIMKLVLSVAAFAALVTATFTPQLWAQRHPRVAVLDFDYGTVESVSSSIFGTNVDIGKGISALLVTNLVKNGTFSVIDRSSLDKVLAEQNFSNSNRADPSTAARIAKILGVDYIIVGTITEFGNETSKQNVGGGGASFHGFGVGSIGHSNSKANVVINARIINIDTAEILAAAEGKGQSSRSGMSLGGGGGNWGGMGGGNVDFGSSNFQSTIIGEATKKAVEALAADLGTQSSHLTVRAVKIDALIAAVDGGQIILNAGARAGIHSGDQLTVVRVGREIKDPATGQVIRRLTSTIGTIQAADVDDTSSVCNVVSGSGFQVGDHAVTPGTSPGAGGGVSAAPAAAPESHASTAPSAPQTFTPITPPADPNAGGGDQPNFTALKADFIPGDKAVFFDDFSDMSGDDAPPHWKIRGATPELRVAGITRELALIGDRYDIYPNITGLPKNFTMEMDLLCEKDGGNVGGCGGINWYFHSKSGREEWLFKIWISLDRATEDKKMIEYRIGLWDDKEGLGTKTLTTDWRKPVKLAMWVQNGRVRFYVNGDRVFDFNQVEVGEIASLDMNFWTGDATIALRRVRFAESTPDFSQTIASSGKFVTHGILFDTDSDRVKPESAAVIQSIAKGLMQASDVNFEIDGHSDATGNAAHNMDLSKRRAEAVKSILVSQFSVDAGRLTTAGFGSSKPLDSNSTPEGKANNRRVEFVRK